MFDLDSPLCRSLLTSVGIFDRTLLEARARTGSHFWATAVLNVVNVKGVVVSADYFASMD